MLNKKGLSMVELIIIIAIMGIVFTAISSFLINNIKTFNRADNQIEAQYNAQIAMNEIVDNVMATKKITELNYYSGDSVDYITFAIIDAENNDEYIKYDFDKNDQTLSWGKNSNSLNKYAENIKNFEVKTIEINKVIRGVKITITTEVNDSEIKLTNDVYFRNASN